MTWSRRIGTLAASLSILVPLLVAPRARADDGYIGVYADAAGTRPCAYAPPRSTTVLYVIAKTNGRSKYGIMGAEFRIEVTSPSGWMFSYTAPSGANVVAGDPIDTTTDPNTGGGVDLSFSTCQIPANGMLALGTLSVVNVQGTATDLVVKRHSTPKNGNSICPLFVLCDGPTFSKACMSPSKEPGCGAPFVGDAGSATDPAISSLTLNPTAAPVALAAPAVVFADTIPLGNSALWVMGEQVPGPNVRITFDGTMLSFGGIAVAATDWGHLPPADSDDVAGAARSRLQSIRAALAASPVDGSLVMVTHDAVGTFVGEMRAQVEKQIA
jgi:hypothetical protein